VTGGVAAVAIGAVIVGVAAIAAAEPRVTVTGDDRAGVTAAVRKALDPHVELVDDGDADAVVTVEVAAGKKKWRATVTAFDAAGARLAGYEVSARKARLGKDTGRRAWKKLGSALAAAEPPPPPPPPEPAPEPVAAAAPASPPGPEIGVVAALPRPPRTGPARVEVTVDGRPFVRTLRYNDDLHQELRGYDLAAPAAGVTATWRPLGRYLAVRGELELAIGIEGSRTTDGMELATSASEWSAGVRGELPVGGWRWTIDASYGEHRFTIDDEAIAQELVPDVTYRWLRGGVGVAVPVGARLTVDAGAGWRQLVDTGELASAAWFPRASGAGVDAELGASWRLAGAITVFGRADLRRYFFAMNPEVGDARIAGGAIDQYVAIVAGLGVALR
jgi:hypothetical protein